MSVESPVWAVTAERIDEAVRRLVAAARPVRIILFGSHARGDARDDSDVDLLVVEASVQDASREAVRLRRALRGLLMPIDLVVVQQDKYDYWRDTPGNVYFEAAQDGRALYEAA